MGSRLEKGRIAALAIGLLGLLLALGASARLLVTGDLTPDSGGAIRVYSNAGTFMGLFDAPTAPATLDGPSAIRLGPDGNVYVISSSDTVLRYDQAGHYVGVFIPSGSNGLGEAKDMVFGPDGNLYISSNLSSCVGSCGERGEILRFNGQTGAFIDHFVPTLAGEATGCGRLSEAMGLAFGPDGNLLVGNDASGICPNVGNDRPYNVLKFNGTTGAFMSVFIATNSQRMYDPNNILVGPDGNLYISEENCNIASCSIASGRILRYNGTTGAFINEFVPNGSGGIDEPEGIAFGPDGNLYVASGDGVECDNNATPPVCNLGNGNMVYRYSGSTGALLGAFVTDGLTANWSDPKGILFLPDANNVVVPTLGEWSLIGLSFVLLGLGWRHVRRRLVHVI